MNKAFDIRRFRRCVKDLLGAERIYRFQPVPVFSAFQIEIHELRLPAALEAARLIQLVRSVFLQGSEQERPEFALRAVNPNQGLMVEQLDEKTLHEPIGLPYWFR